jgi:hypothetical protein
MMTPTEPSVSAITCWKRGWVSSPWRRQKIEGAYEEDSLHVVAVTIGMIVCRMVVVVVVLVAVSAVRGVPGMIVSAVQGKFVARARVRVVVPRLVVRRVSRVNARRRGVVL